MGERDDPDRGVTTTIESARRRLAGDEGDAVMRQVRNVGISAWTIIGVGLVLATIVGIFASLSEIALPFVLAVVVGASAYPVAGFLQRRGLSRGLAAAAVLVASVLFVLGLLWVVVATVVDQADALTDQVDAAMEEVQPVADDVGIDPDALDEGRQAVGDLAPMITDGFVTLLVDGVDALIGFVGGTVLAVLILYYVLKDGPSIRDRGIDLVPTGLRDDARAFTSSAVGSLRAYWRGRALLSAAVTAVVVVACLAMGLPLIATIAVVNFVGGFVPYIGAFIGGGLATIIALGDRGFVPALILLAIIVFANVVFENMIEPRIMSGQLAIHPLLVLIATTLGGLLGGIVGLVVAVPLVVIGIDLVRRLNDVARRARSG